jgi:hypothetical protein
MKPIGLYTSIWIIGKEARSKKSSPSAPAPDRDGGTPS